MSERNQIKARTCRLCGENFLGKASVLKEHSKACKSLYMVSPSKESAEATLKRMQQEMLSPADTLEREVVSQLPRLNETETD